MRIRNLKPRAIEFFHKHKFKILLGVLAFILFYFYKKPFIIEGSGSLDWDAYGYIKDIYWNQISFLMWGRIGYIFFFSTVWKILNAFNFPILEFHNAVRLFNIIFASFSIVFFYLTIKNIFKNKLIAIGSSLILLFSKDFINYSGRVYTESMMIFFIILSYYFFTKSFESKKSWHLYLSAALFGFAFEIRESALLSIFFFLVYYIYKRKDSTFTLKNYSVFCITMFITAMIGPFIIYLMQGQKYINQILYWSKFQKGTVVSYPIMLRLGHVYQNITDGFGFLVLPLLGMIILSFKHKYKELLIAISLIIPILIYTFYGNMLERFFIIGYLGLSLFTAITLFYIINYLQFSRTLRKYAFIMLLIILLIVNFINFHSELKEEQKYALYVEQYGLHLLNDFPENTEYIIGARRQALNYFIDLTEPKPKKGTIGLGGTPDEFKEKIKKKLLENKTIVIDPNQFYFPDETENVKKILNDYPSYKDRQGLYILNKNISLIKS
jgi:hypothetical protein